MSFEAFPILDDLDVWDDGAAWTEDVASLLPPDNSGAAELAIEQVSARGALFADLIRPLWRPDDCPEHLLPWLAWTLSVDSWEPGWPEEDRREVVRQSVWVHRHKGTIGSIRRALIAAGYGDATVIERYANNRHNGLVAHDGSKTYGSPDHWAEYRVRLARPITNAQAEIVRGILADVAPARCHLKSLDFQAVAYVHDGTVRHDGSVNYGAA